jgi:nitroreductase
MICGKGKEEDPPMIVDLQKKRYSARIFQDKPVPDDIVKEIIEAGRLCPSGGNEQPWLFGVITDRDLIGMISQVSYNQEWIAKAPLLIVLCTRIVEDKRGGRDIQKKRFPAFADAIDEMDRDLYSAVNLEEHQTKIPGSVMSLAALEHGVASTWVSLFDVEKLAELLKLPDGYVPSEFLALGYPTEDGGPSPKKKARDIVFYNTAESLESGE